MNKDGRLNIKVELKKNAAGNYPLKILAALTPSYMTPMQVPDTYGETKISLEELTSSMEIDDWSKKFDRKPPLLLKISSDPYPRGLGSVLQPASSQLTMYRHYQYIQFFLQVIFYHSSSSNFLILAQF